MLKAKKMGRNCNFFIFLFFFSIINGGVLDAWPKGSVTRFYNFKVMSGSNIWIWCSCFPMHFYARVNIIDKNRIHHNPPQPPRCQACTYHFGENNFRKKLCKTSTIVTVDGMFPGPIIYARQDDRVIVKVTNLTPYNISIHWHGVRQRLTCWFDGPAYITQCPIQAGQSFTYKFTLFNQHGTLFWHAHISWLRATVHGPIVIYPKQGASYPFELPLEEHVIVLGEYWIKDIQELEKEVRESGAGPPGSDAYLFNGHPGPFHNCSKAADVFTIDVIKGKIYLLRIINAALNMEHFFGVANHQMTVVEVDGEYTKPFSTSFLMLTPGQTYNILIKANQPIGKYYMAMAPYMPAKNVPFLNKTSYALFNYIKPKHKNSSLLHQKLHLPSVIDTDPVQSFTNRIKSLTPNEHFPLKIDKYLFFAIGLNVFSCNSSSTHGKCQGPNGGMFAASVNNITFRRPIVSLLNAYYYNSEGFFSMDFPDKPEKMYDFVKEAPNDIGVDTQPEIGTRVSVLEYGWSVQVIFQDTATVGTENHPVHLHGFSFYVLGSGIGNFDPTSAVLNLFDPPYRNTIGVPVGGWAVIRFRADNPGVWFMHCHLDVHTTWGLSMAFLVKNGEGKMQTLPPPPPDLPPC